MTAPAHAVETGDTGRYYKHPVTGDLLLSVTNAAKSLVDEGGLNGLMGWAARLTADKWRDEFPAALTASMNPAAFEEFYKASKRERIRARDHASALGTMVHAQANADILDQDVDRAAFARQHPDSDGTPMPTEQVDALYSEATPYTQQYLQWRDDFAIRGEHIEASEMTVADPARGYAGTLDLVAWLPIDPATGRRCRKRHLFVVDFKTSATSPRTRVYDATVMQLAAYRYATEAWVGDEVVAMPTGIEGGAVLNLRQRSNALIPLPADEAAHAAFCAVVPAVRWMHALDIGAYKPLDPPGKERKPRRTNSQATPFQSATRDIDPLALAAEPTTEVPF